jgi:hypothetical protein
LPRILHNQPITRWPENLTLFNHSRNPRRPKIKQSSLFLF